MASLQRTLGNQAMLRLFESGLLQAKLRVSQPVGRSTRLNLILDWIKKNPSAFPSPIQMSGRSGQKAARREEHK